MSTDTFSLDDVRSLLEHEMPSTNKEERMYAALTWSGHLMFEFIKDATANNDEAALRSVCTDSTPLHNLIARYAPTIDPWPGLDELPFDPKGKPIIAAVRGLAALGLALVADQPDEHLGAALKWLRVAQHNAPAQVDLPTTAWDCGHPEKMAALTNLLAEENHRLTALVWLLAIDGAELRERQGPAVNVLLDAGSSGAHATLRLIRFPQLPSGLVPDPRAMGLFSADTGFLGGLNRAWEQAGKSVDGTVCWTLDNPDGPITHVQDFSLTAPFTVVIDEIRRTQSRIRSFLAVRRIRSKTAITGGVDAQGRLVSVSGYRSKFSAAKAIERIVVPADDASTARGLANELKPDTEINVAETWQAAARYAREMHRILQFRLGGAIGGVIVLIAGLVTGGVIWHEAKERAVLGTAEDVAAEAWNLAHGDSDGLALLLAMASDDIAAQVGEVTTNFDQIARTHHTIVKLLNAPHGSYREPAISFDGTKVLLHTNTGVVELVSTLDGAILWNREYPPGLEMHEEQTHVNATTFAPYESQAAISTSDRTITIISPSEGIWSETASIQVPVEERSGALGFELNTIDWLRYSPDASALAGYGARVGLFWFDLEDASAPPQRCDPVPDVVDLFVGEDGPVLVTGTAVMSVDLETCETEILLNGPDGATIHAVGTDTDGTLIAVATRGAALLAVRPDQSESVLSDRGPYFDPLATESWDGLHVSARSDSGTYGWLIDIGGQEFGFPDVGYARASGGPSVVVHDGIAAIHDRRGTPARIFFEEGVWADEVGWAENFVIRRNSVSIAYAPMNSDGIDIDRGGVLPIPENSRIDRMALSLGEPWAAVIVSDQETGERSLLWWDLETQAHVEIAVEGAVPLELAFVDGELLVADTESRVLRFENMEGEWTQNASVELPTITKGLAARDGDGNVFAVVSDTATDSPTVVRIDMADFAIGASVDLEGAIGNSDLTVLRDGQVVVGYGSGNVAFFNQKLALRGMHTSTTLQTIISIAEIPELDQVLVSGTRGSVVLHRVTRTVQAEEWYRGGPFSDASTSPDGNYLVTANLVESQLAIWTLNSEDLRKRTCDAVGRDLTAEEWQRFVGDAIPYHPVCPV
ncbi:hypothetical protein [Glycomyces sp. NRRL B-16210]|uniref:hypothetical protein n=1 Tax=Glycomyces sp. NRRL B-16210 TaxID=1463821 RepID=UPI0004BFBD76|nr:hypothetical protein [Glycomyces sp. NRRL B-16210]